MARKQGAADAAGCDDLAAKTATLRQQFAKEPRWLAIIDRIEQVVGE